MRLPCRERDEALQLFREAETMQAAHQPSYPLLYSVRGFHYCDLLLAAAERAAWQRVENPEVMAACRAVEQCVETIFQWRRLPSWNPSYDSLLDIALDPLTLSRAAFYRALLDHSALDPSTLRDAQLAIEKAVDGLRAAGTMDHLPRGLLTRAWLRCVTGDTAGARTDLDEA
jgi:hypothetical protein